MFRILIIFLVLVNLNKAENLDGCECYNGYFEHRPISITINKKDAGSYGTTLPTPPEPQTSDSCLEGVQTSYSYTVTYETISIDEPDGWNPRGYISYQVTNTYTTDISDCVSCGEEEMSYNGTCKPCPTGSTLEGEECKCAPPLLMSQNSDGSLVCVNPNSSSSGDSSTGSTTSSSSGDSSTGSTTSSSGDSSTGSSTSSSSGGTDCPEGYTFFEGECVDISSSSSSGDSSTGSTTTSSSGDSSTGSSTSSSSGGTDCPAGQIRCYTGECAFSQDLCGDGDDCPTGQHMNENYQCVNDETDCPHPDTIFNDIPFVGIMSNEDCIFSGGWTVACPYPRLDVACYRKDNNNSSSSSNSSTGGSSSSSGGLDTNNTSTDSNNSLDLDETNEILRKINTDNNDNSKKLLIEIGKLDESIKSSSDRNHKDITDASLENKEGLQRVVNQLEQMETNSAGQRELLRNNLNEGFQRVIDAINSKREGNNTDEQVDTNGTPGLDNDVNVTTEDDTTKSMMTKAKESADNAVTSVSSSLNGAISSFVGTAPVVTGTGQSVFTANIYGKAVVFDFKMVEQLRQYFDILWILLLAYFNFRMYLFIIRELLNKI